jgi:hypothetical protein
MFYSIGGLEPRKTMGGAGFQIKLWPAFREAVANINRTQENYEKLLKNMGRAWLDCCGFNAVFDPDNCGFQADRKLPPGPNARPLYEPNQQLRISWGEWGPEHITVPGSACGLDIDRDGPGRPRGGAILLPHNVDSWAQAQLLLVVFCWIADDLALNMEIKQYKEQSCPTKTKT